MLTLPERLEKEELEQTLKTLQNDQEKTLRRLNELTYKEIHNKYPGDTREGSARPIEASPQQV